MLNCLVELCIRRVVFSLVLLLYCVVYITDFYRVAVNKVAKNTRVSPERRELPRSVRLGVGWIMGGGGIRRAGWSWRPVWLAWGR